MLENFMATYAEGEVVNTSRELSLDSAPQVPALRYLLARFAGRSFHRGLYRVHTVPDIPKWGQIVTSAFPGYSDGVFCFAHTWLGNQLALDTRGAGDNEPQVLIFGPGTGEVLNTASSFEQFHEIELVEHSDAALASGYYDAWLAAGNVSPDATECVGYKQPLFLNGPDTVENLELCDLDVYWGITGQLLERVRRLPAGTRINNVSAT